MNALKGGALQVVAVDSSGAALQLASENLKLNKFDEAKVEFVNDNAFEYLRKLRDRAEQFDLIVLDPPKFAPTTSQVDKAARAYKDINLSLQIIIPQRSAVHLLLFRRSGITVIPKNRCRCSSRCGKKCPDRWFTFTSAEDHPISSAFPEGEYLKGLICKVTGR